MKYISSDSDDNDDLAMDNADESPSNNRMDAVVSSRANVMKYVDTIDNSLDLYDKLSILFLLYENNNLLLQDLLLLQGGSQKSAIKEWSQYVQKTNSNWYNLLLESLAITQNYRVLAKIGISKQEAYERYLPHSESTMFVNKTKKSLYLLFESLEDHEVDKIMLYIRRDFKRKNLLFNEYDRQLETFFTYLLDVEYVSLSDLTNFEKAIKEVGKGALYESSPNNTRNSTNNIANHTVQTTSQLDRAESTTANSLVPSMVKCSLESNYFIDKDKPGYCLIINQNYFYPDAVRPLLAKRNLPERSGTELDVEAIQRIFSSLQFEVVVESDLRDDQLLGVIEKSLRKAKEYSSFFFFGLSHGEEEVFMSCNSIPVPIKSIKDLICKNFENKPKVVVLQMCQGEALLKVDKEPISKDALNATDFTDLPYENSEDSVMTDGPTPSPINANDLLIFYAAIPGFAAVRNANKGTWCIQTLCEVITNNVDHDHFEEICRKVRGKIDQKRWKGCKMISMMSSTLVKALYLPSHQG